MFADLHLHTHFSDGTYSPEELVAHARVQGLAAIALTDHDTVDGCPRAAAAAHAAGMEFVPGLELTADFDGHEIHLLGYFVDPADPSLRQSLERLQTMRQDRLKEMVGRLQARGISLRLETVLSLANCRAPGRPHVARALVQEKFCATVEEAFERFLKKDRPAFVPRERMAAAAGIGLLHEAGGVAVLAHPGIHRVDPFVPALAAAGLDGLECFHSRHSAADSRKYLDLAASLNLVATGGSDCHGLTKGRPLIGSVRVPLECVARLQARRPRPATTAP